MRAIKLWVGLSKFASDEERGQNQLGVYAVRPPGFLLVSTDQFHDVAAHLWEASIRRLRASMSVLVHFTVRWLFSESNLNLLCGNACP